MYIVNNIEHYIACMYVYIYIYILYIDMIHDTVYVHRVHTGKNPLAFELPKVIQDTVHTSQSNLHSDAHRSTEKCRSWTVHWPPGTRIPPLSLVRHGRPLNGTLTCDNMGPSCSSLHRCGKTTICRSFVRKQMVVFHINKSSN